MVEVWKDIPGYEELYEINNIGKIKTKERTFVDKMGRNYLKKSILCNSNDDGKGYLQIVLTKNGKRKSFKIHKLVAKTFIPNPNNLPQVNHKDENKENNNVDNLEWCTRKYNINYGTRNYRCTRHRLRKINQYNLDNIFIKKYNSLKEAGEQTNIKYQNISSCCRNKSKTAGGYIWKYC